MFSHVNVFAHGSISDEIRTGKTKFVGIHHILYICSCEYKNERRLGKGKTTNSATDQRDCFSC